MNIAPVKILLIGAGWFGQKHLQVLLALAKQGKINLAGIVEKNKALRKELKNIYHTIPVFSYINENILKRIDAVDIVTTTNTHFNLVKKCLRYTDVFVEKPLAETPKQANKLSDLSRKYRKILMVGHIFRFHPITKDLKTLFVKKGREPSYVKGVFVSPFNTWKNGKTAALDNLHFFDVLDYVFGEMPIIVTSKVKGRVTTAELRYPNGMNAIFELGWRGEEKERVLDFYFQNKNTIRCDFKRNFIKIDDGKERKKVIYDLKIMPLEAELKTFIKLLNKKNVSYVDGGVAKRIVDIAYKVDSLS